jgi:phosphatidylinositol alpha-1,6-mannosyltransferase
MKITVLHNLPPGGARRRLASQLSYMNGEIIEICPQTATPITPDAAIVPLRQLAPRMSRVLRPPLRYGDLVGLELAWRDASVRLREVGADVIYLNPDRYVGAPPLLTDRLPPVLYFCDEPRRVDYETAAKDTRNQRTRLLYGPLYARERHLDRRTMERAALVATNSQYTAGEIARVYGREATVITMGVEESLIGASDSSVDAGFLLTVGALIPSKGHDLVIRAAAMASQSRPVVLVAPRPDPAEEQRLRALAADLGVDLQVRVGISDRTLGELFRSAHATLYMAAREPFGLVSIEAQACGCPVIVADEGGLPETIADGVTGWKSPRDPKATALLLDRLDDPGVRGTMSAEAQARAHAQTWRQSAAEVETLLRNLMVGSPGADPVQSRRLGAKPPSGDARGSRRILLLSPVFPPATGGIERTAGALAEGLTDYDIEVVAGRPASSSGMRPPVDVRVHWSANRPAGGRKATFALARLSLRVGLGFRPDVVLVLHIRAMPAARAVARLLGARLVLVIHAKEIREQPALARAAVGWADALVTISRFSYELAVEVGADERRITMINPGVIVPPEPPPQLSDRQGPPTLITVSRLSEANKGHDVALEAMALLRGPLPDARWIMVGDGTLRPALQDRAAELGLTGSVSFPGMLDDVELERELNAAHAFCLLSRPAPAGAAGEGFGIVFIEAGAHGLPVVAGRTPGVVDAVSDGVNGLLVDPTDPEAVAQVLERVLTDPQLAERLATAGRARAEELDWTQVTRRYASVINDVLAGPARSTRSRRPGWIVDLVRGPG